jgi:hypothetical protein|tara:strand:+ start:265 stop:519 length:255 start_codon:yes stop_codon:yes gene_type:complete
MLDITKFQKKLTCVCKNIVLFEIIPEIECDWGCHTVIQCPVCEELFSVDMRCPAFQTIEKLLKENITLYTSDEQSSYFSESHPF